MPFPCLPFSYDAQRRRVYVLGARIHHGGVGVVLIAVGTALLFHDRRDWPFPLRDSA